MSGTNTGTAQDKVEITIRIDRKLHERMQNFFAFPVHYGNYSELVEALLQALTKTDDTDWLHQSFLDLLWASSQQRNVGFEEHLFGRAGNEHDRQQLYGLMLGMERYELPVDRQQEEFDDKGPETFAHDMARRLARDLNRFHAANIITVMTAGEPELTELMLHWLDVYLAEEKKR